MQKQVWRLLLVATINTFVVKATYWHEIIQSKKKKLPFDSLKLYSNNDSLTPKFFLKIIRGPIHLNNVASWHILNLMLRFCFKGNLIGSFILFIMGEILPCSALHMKGLRPSHLAPYQWSLSCPVVYIPTQSVLSSPFGPPKFHFSNWSGLPSDQMNPSSTSQHETIAFIGYILEYHFWTLYLCQFRCRFQLG